MDLFIEKNSFIGMGNITKLYYKKCSKITKFQLHTRFVLIHPTLGFVSENFYWLKVQNIL